MLALGSENRPSVACMVAMYMTLNCVLIDCADMMEFWIVKLSMLRGVHTQKATETELKREIQIVSILAHLYTPGRACWFWKATQIAVGSRLPQYSDVMDGAF